jgi:hypothetical protein
MMGETNRYPFNVASLQSAKKTLGDYYKVSEDQVLITAGSGEGLACWHVISTKEILLQQI